MQITVHIQVQDDDTFDSSPDEVAQSVLEVLEGDSETDIVSVTIQPAPKSASLGTPPVPPKN
jgi:hypothetical protein